MPANAEVNAGLVDELLAPPTREQQESFLRAAKLLDPDGLDRLLDLADELLGGDPGKARRLAEICADFADDASAPAVVPRASYIRAGAYNLNGEFEEDLHLTKAAYNGYIALGMNLEALRTNVGKMAALLELGRYGEALDAGQVVLEALDGRGELEVTPVPEESDLLAALVHQNRGGCLEYMGRYDEALDAYAIAEDFYRDLGMTERLGEIGSNRGAILLYLGRGSEALAAHEATAAIFDKTDLTLLYAKALANMGEAHLQLSNYTRSLDVFERTRRLLDSIEALADGHLLLRDMANAYLALNLYSEAVASYREADSLLRTAGMAHDRARALWGMGSALVAGSELEEAERILAEAAALFDEAGNAPLLSGVMLEQASLLASSGNQAAALATARQALDLISGNEWPVQLVYAHLRLADLLLPDVTEVEPHLLEAQRLVDRLALPQLRYRLNERLGRLRRVQGRDEEARALLEAAVDEIESMRGTVTQDSMRISFLRDKIAAYEELLRLYLAQDEDDARLAFAVAERAKSRALVDLLTGVCEAEPKTLADPELERRLRVLQADLNAIYNQLLGSPGDGERRAPIPDLHARAAELEGEINRLRLQAAATGPTPDPFAAPVAPDLMQDGLLADDVTLLAYHIVGEEVMAFVSVRGHVRAVRRLGEVAAVQRLLQKLTVQWDRFRAGREFAGRHAALLEQSARQVLAALHAQLIAPLEPLLEEAADVTSGEAGPVQGLAIVPHGPLHQVPFHALFDGQRYLIERFEVSYAPSATVYALCQKQAPRSSDGALVFGVEDPLIPEAAAEARAVAERLPGAEVRVGQGATVAALRSEAPGYGVLHLACHGLFRSDNPMFSALKLHDGWLMAADAMGLDLDGALVTLSACESGRNEVIGGDEILGLTRAFLGAGAATLVVSLWLVQDETTAELMGEWYERMRDGEGRASALRAAQLEIKERRLHPYYWAPFVLVGRR